MLICHNILFKNRYFKASFFFTSFYCLKVGKVFIPGLPAPSLTMSNPMPRPSTPLDSVSTPMPLSKLLGSLDEVRKELGVVRNY